MKTYFYSSQNDHENDVIHRMASWVGVWLLWGPGDTLTGGGENPQFHIAPIFSMMQTVFSFVFMQSEILVCCAHGMDLMRICVMNALSVLFELAARPKQGSNLVKCYISIICGSLGKLCETHIELVYWLCITWIWWETAAKFVWYGFDVSQLKLPDSSFTRRPPELLLAIRRSLQTQHITTSTKTQQQTRQVAKCICFEQKFLELSPKSPLMLINLIIYQFQLKLGCIWMWTSR